MSSRAAATPNAATPNAATPASSVRASAAATPSGSSVSSAVAASSSAQASTSASASASANAAASSATSSSAAFPASASGSGSGSSSHSSSSASQSASLISGQIVNATSTANVAALTGSTGLSHGAIGGIVGGVVGGLVVLVLLWTWWRRRKTRGEKVPPPPPRDMAYHPQSLGRNGPSSMATMGHQRRASTYSSLLPPRASSTYNSHSRQPSFYTTYPIATPSSGSHEASPPMPPSTSSGSSDAPSLSTGGANTPGGVPLRVPEDVGETKPVLAPIVTQLSRDNSASSGEMRAGPRPRHVSSIDRLRSDGQGANRGPDSDRASSPVSTRPTSEMGLDFNSRANSPHASLNGFPSPGSLPRPMSSRPGGYPRPSSMNSLSSSRYLHVGPAGRAPHQGRPIQLEMPRLLGARPDSNGDFFGSTGRFNEGPALGLDEMGRMTRSSRYLNEQSYSTSPMRTRIPSNQSLSNRSNLGPGSSDEHSESQHFSTPRQEPIRAPERIADPRTVLRRP